MPELERRGWLWRMFAPAAQAWVVAERERRQRVRRAQAARAAFESAMRDRCAP